MGPARFVVVVAAAGLLVGCASSATPSPSATPSAASLREWDSYVATGTDGVWTAAPDGLMRACGSLREFIGGFVTTYHGPKPVLGYEGWARVLAQSQCSTGNFSDTLICKQVAITPTPMPGL